tara:strand:+ start:679 stop:819 length:141 start_codon:yes stop_codon:yes gene_type:complete
MEKKTEEQLVAESNKHDEDEMVEKAVSLAACQYERNFGMTQCGCAS